MTGALPVAQDVAPPGGADDTVTLSYDDRFLRRKRLVSDGGLAFVVDLAKTTSVEAGECFVLADGRKVAVAAADENLLEVRGDLPRLAWHVGNRHTPCQIEADRLLIQRDHVIRDMLNRLGAEVAEIVAPFSPEGGAYGHGRTHAHEHGHTTHHGHSHDH
ncbi:urease accessory protein [Rhodovulum iodosum]|uniref:Urease accessory protein UreE n=1 Tax=Rhodovulum iodosum TaxID=68291 RepID=A0ABV3XS86_9RHOB|nr:urease accessory protein UreE [Rhodovulum robiginosum]RSK30522.1 urease accessory protein UreE [Rhodovulum robiginosum]